MTGTNCPAGGRLDVGGDVRGGDARGGGQPRGQRRQVGDLPGVDADVDDLGRGEQRRTRRVGEGGALGQAPGQLEVLALAELGVHEGGLGDDLPAVVALLQPERGVVGPVRGGGQVPGRRPVGGGRAVLHGHARRARRTARRRAGRSRSARAARWRRPGRRSPRPRRRRPRRPSRRGRPARSPAPRPHRRRSRRPGRARRAGARSAGPDRIGRAPGQPLRRVRRSRVDPRRPRGQGWMCIGRGFAGHGRQGTVTRVCPDSPPG